MPISKSAKKAYRVSERKRAQNLKAEVRLSKALKNVNKDNVNEVISIVDKTAKTNLIHKNKAARIKSKLSKTFSSVKNEVKPAATEPKAQKAVKKTVKAEPKAKKAAKK